MNQVSIGSLRHCELRNTTLQSALENLAHLTNPRVALIGKTMNSSERDRRTIDQNWDYNSDIGRLSSSVESKGVSVGAALVTSPFAFDNTEYVVTPAWASEFDGTRPPVFELARSSDLTVILPQEFTEWQLHWLMQMSRRPFLY